MGLSYGWLRNRSRVVRRPSIAVKTSSSMPTNQTRLQGGRLTAWELVQEAFHPFIATGGCHPDKGWKVDLILVGADRIALNGDTANKIGTFMLSVLAKNMMYPSM